MCQTIQWPACNKTLTYPPNTVYPLRSHSEIVREAEASQNGIFGISPLTSMINLVDSVHYMHAVLEGVTRWLAKSYKEPYYLGRKSADIDSELLKQTPPHEFNRPPPPDLFRNTLNTGNHQNYVHGFCITHYLCSLTTCHRFSGTTMVAPLWTAGVCNS